jgi:hypothetical protein
VRALPYDEWRARYCRMREIAERVDRMRLDRARKLCAEAGLDPGLLGIHPHNAMCCLRWGSPWPGVDYGKVRACLRMMRRQSEGYRVLERWSARTRCL